jgi:CRP-like cAMP-binding protein
MELSSPKAKRFFTKVIAAIACTSCSKGQPTYSVGETLVESATPGALLSEMALVDSSPRTATVVATEPCRLAKIDQRRFHFLVQQTPYFATHVMKVLTERLRHMNLLTKTSSVA